LPRNAPADHPFADATSNAEPGAIPPPPKFEVLWSRRCTSTLPATPTVVAIYLTDLAKTGVRRLEVA
jgi:hypothetical protein